MIWYAGEMVPDENVTVSVLDRTFEHGLGLFESMRTWNGRCTLLDRHRDRLLRTARALGLALVPGQLPDQASVAALVAAQQITGDAMLRITTSGGRNAQDPPQVWMRAWAAPEAFPAPWSLFGGVDDPTRRIPDDGDELAAAKTLNYWARRRAHERALAADCDEALLITSDGNVREGSRTSLFAVVNDELLTPALCINPASAHVKRPILNAIMRSVVIERATARGWTVCEREFLSVDWLAGCSELFLTNAVRGVIPVGRWGSRTLPAPGPWTQKVWDDLRPWLHSGGVST